MQYEKINLIYFSATGSTEKILEQLAQTIGGRVVKHRLTAGATETISIPATELALFGVPVYAGRVPQIAAEALSKFIGEDTPALVVCVYGNRHFDDALLELQTLVTQNRFNVISAAAFIAQHTIFPQIAAGRPDSQDWVKIDEFAQKSRQILAEYQSLPDTPLAICGNTPYREAKAIPLKPRTNRLCTGCRLCERECPVQAISPEDPRKTDPQRCISCARCIAVCPAGARYFGGLLYNVVSWKFKKHCAARREPYLVYPVK